jgi:hypothetical protein
LRADRVPGDPGTLHRLLFAPLKIQAQLKVSVRFSKVGVQQETSGSRASDPTQPSSAVSATGALILPDRWL